MTRRAAHIQIRVTEGEKGAIERRARREGMSVSELVRKALLGDLTVTEPPAGAAEPVPPPEATASDLAERREERARLYARRMPLVNARRLAAKEIPE